MQFCFFSEWEMFQVPLMLHEHLIWIWIACWCCKCIKDLGMIRWNGCYEGKCVSTCITYHIILYIICFSCECPMNNSASAFHIEICIHNSEIESRIPSGRFWQLPNSRQRTLSDDEEERVDLGNRSGIRSWWHDLADLPGERKSWDSSNLVKALSAPLLGIPKKKIPSNGMHLQKAAILRKNIGKSEKLREVSEVFFFSLRIQTPPRIE